MRKTKAEKQNIFRRCAKSLRTFGADTAEVWHKGNARCRTALAASYVCPGVGQMLTGQLIKGLIMLCATAGYVLFMVLWGATAVKGFFTLNTPDVLSQYNIVYGLLAFVVTAFMLGLYIAGVKGVTKNGKTLLQNEKPNGIKADLKLLTTGKFYITLLVIPVVGALAFTVIPLLFMIAIAFTNFSTNTGAGGVVPAINQRWLSWTGFAAFKYLFSVGDNLKTFGSVLGWTLIWAVLATFTCYFGGLFLAMLLNKKVVKAKTLWRTLFIIVMATPQIVSLRIMYSMFHNNGPINGLLLRLGLIATRIEFWDNEYIAKALIVVINMWVGIPYFMLLMSGLLINIPADYYEYASIEGASRMYMFKRITLPYILFLTGPVIITSFVQNINNFNVIFLLTGGNPKGAFVNSVAGKTDILITWLYKLTMQRSSVAQYNLGAAIGIIMFILSVTFSLLSYRRSKAYKGEGDFA